MIAEAERFFPQAVFLDAPPWPAEERLKATVSCSRLALWRGCVDLESITLGNAALDRFRLIFAPMGSALTEYKGGGGAVGGM